MSRLTRVLRPDEVQVLRDHGNDSIMEESINEEQYDNEEEYDNAHGGYQKKIKDEEDYNEGEEEYSDDENDDIEYQEEYDEDKPGSMEQKLLNMSPEETDVLLSKLQLTEIERGEEDDDTLVLEDDSTIVQIEEKKNKTKNAPKQEKKPTTKASKQGKKEENIEETKSKKGRNKKAELTKGENITDHPLHSVDHNAGTKQKKGNNKNQHPEEEPMTNDLPIEKEKAVIKELPPRKYKGKKQVPVSEEAHEDNLPISSKDASHTNEDTKSKKPKRGKVEQSLKEDSMEYTQDKLTSDVTKKPNKAEEAASKTSKENKAKAKSEKGKSKIVDNTGLIELEPEVTEIAKSGKGKQKHAASGLKENKNSKDGMKKDDTEIKENTNERPKRNIPKKVYEEKILATAVKGKKVNKVNQQPQSHSNDPKIGSMVDNAPTDTGKAKPQSKGKKNPEGKENKTISEPAVKKTVSRKK